jgi:hypothetical protein
MSCMSKHFLVLVFPSKVLQQVSCPVCQNIYFFVLVFPSEALQQVSCPVCMSKHLLVLVFPSEVLQQVSCSLCQIVKSSFALDFPSEVLQPVHMSSPLYSGFPWKAWQPVSCPCMSSPLSYPGFPSKVCVHVKSFLVLAFPSEIFETSLMSCLESWLLSDLRYTVHGP